MAGNTRGKLKEKFEGVHRNFDWAQKHCEESLELIGTMNPKLSIGINSLHHAISELDKLAQEIYSHL